jgi:hypothetical protein
MKSNKRREEPITDTYIVLHMVSPGYPLELDTKAFQTGLEQHTPDQVCKPYESCPSDFQASLLALHQLDAAKEGSTLGVEEYFIQFVRAICGWDQQIQYP